MPISTLKSIAITMRRSYPSFGGVMLWDASQAYGEKSRYLWARLRREGDGRDGFHSASIFKLLAGERADRSVVCCFYPVYSEWEIRYGDQEGPSGGRRGWVRVSGVLGAGVRVRESLHCRPKCFL